MASALISFDLQKTYANSIEIKDLGEFALRCTSAEFEDYYIAAQTTMGKTFILKFGPILADVDELCDEFFLSYKKIDYKEGTIIKEINSLLNDAKKGINATEEITLQDALQAIPTADRFIPA